MSLAALLLLGLLAPESRRVARVELPAPGHSPFLLHACVPLPHGTWPRADGRSPFRVLSHDALRAEVPAQVEIVSRYPDGTADVVELLARVELAPGEHENQRVAYWVTLGEPEEAPAFAPPPRVAALLARNSRNLLLRTQDVYGNVYLADLCGDASDAGFGSLRLEKDGRWERETRLYATLAPSLSKSAEGEPLPHLMGVHAYLRQHASAELVALDLRINNGATPGARAPERLEQPLGAVYWRSLELLVPAEWSAVPEVRDPFLGEEREEGRWRVLPLVKPLPDGKLHFMPPQAQFERRLALVPRGHEDLAHDELRCDGLAFAQRGPELWSWFDPATARYFPQRALLGSVDFYQRAQEHGKAAVRLMETARMREYQTALETGTPRGWYTIASVMGWAHPWFLNTQSGFGGEGIATTEGYYTAASASREGYQHFRWLHRMNVCRQSEASYDQRGEPVGYPGWLGADGKVPFDFRLNGGIRPPCFLLPMSYGPPPSAQVLEVVKRGLRPPYDMGTWYEKSGTWPDRIDNILAWWPHDDQHMVRYTKNAKALVWLGNDSLAKDDLILSGELFHLMMHESPHVEASWSLGMTIPVWEQIAKDHPHQGLCLGRDLAWGLDSMAAAYSVASPAWRERNRAWFERFSDVLLAGALPSGVIQRSLNPRVLGDDRYTVTQTFETLFLLHGMRCVVESVFRGVDEARRSALEKLALRTLDYLYWGPPFARVAADWQPDPAHPSVYLQGPRWGFAISKNDPYETPPFADAAKWGPNYMPADGLGGGVETYHCFWALDWGRQISESSAGRGLDNKYLRRTLECWVPHKDFGELKKALEEQTRDESQDNSCNWIPFLGALQALGVH